jgi:hypothetical protein
LATRALPPSSRLLVALALAAALAAGSSLAWKAWRDPAVPWLEAHGTTDWILYPSSADPVAKPTVELGTEFRREFTLREVPDRATLVVRAFRTATILLNGRRVPLPDGGSDWKSAREVDVGPLLRSGTNVFQAWVTNHDAPPCLWLEIRAPDPLLATDGRWTASLAGAAARPARTASSPFTGRAYDPFHRSLPAWEGLRKSWTAILGILLVAVLLGVAVSRAGRAATGSPDADSPWPLRIGLALASVLWAASFLHAVDAPPLPYGFDAPQHLEYVQYILDRRAIPLADEGWQMFQPPLYYAILAGLLEVAGLSTRSPGAVVVVRSLGLVLGVANLALVAGLLRRLVRSGAEARLTGLAVATFLPAMLVLYRFPTNEILAATLSSGVLVALLDVLRGERPTIRGAVGLGALLGLALLAKFSTLLLVPVVVGALGLRVLLSPRPGRSAWLRASLVTVATAAVACGWHFARVWQRFGDPFVGGWEARRGFGWWVDPGLRTLQHFTSFGRVFRDPFFAGFGGFWDGIYSTLWGDGMLSGLGSAILPTWWPPDLHAAGFLLAVVPTALAMMGFAATTVRLVRRPSLEDGVLLAVPVLVLVALLAMSVRVASVAQDKAAYGLMALGSLAVLAARGFDVASRIGRPARLVTMALLLTWGGTAYLTFWTVPDSTSGRIANAISRASAGDVAGGVAVLRAAIASDPSSEEARLTLARVLLDHDGPQEEIGALLRPGVAIPGIPGRGTAIAQWALRGGDRDLALASAEEATRSEPDSVAAFEMLARARQAAGSRDGAIAAWQEVLRIRAHDGVAHRSLERLFLQAGDPARAAFHRGYAVRLGE